MRIPNFIKTFALKLAAKNLGKMLKEGNLEDKKKWYQSKTIITSIVTAVMGLYLSLQPQFGWPAVPEWVFAILGAIGVYSRVTATTKIG